MLPWTWYVFLYKQASGERLQLRQTLFFFFGANMVLENARFRVQGYTSAARSKQNRLGPSFGECFRGTGGHILEQL